MNGIGELIGEGRTAGIYEYGQDKVLKLFKPGYDYMADEEYAKHRIARNCNIRVPELFDRVSEDDRKGLVYQRLNGKNMLDIILQSPVKAIRMVKLMAQIHMQIGRCRVDSLETVSSRMANDIQRAPGLGEQKKAQLLDYIETLPNGNCLCHGDFHPGNIMIEKDGAYTIDWMTARQGNFAADVARTMVIVSFGVLSELNTSKTIVEAVRFLGNIYYKQLLKCSAVSRADVEKWIPVIIAARLVEGNSEREQKALLDKLEKYEL